MEKLSIILSIIASIGTIISIVFNLKLKQQLNELKEIKGDRNIQVTGDKNTNVTGDRNTLTK